MTYVVKFGASDAERFRLLYEAFVVGGTHIEGRKDIETLRRELSVLDKLSAISERPAGVPDDQEAPTRTLHPGDHTVTLDHPEYQMVKKHLSAMVSVTSTRGARRIVELVDWFDSLKGEEKAGEAKPARKK